MIDWTKPIETVPCERNPVPVSCRYNPQYAGVALLGCWFDNDGENEGDDPTWYWGINEDGTFVTLMGAVRNVQPSDQPTVTMELSREMHRALVDAGYADLGDYVKRWGDGE